jgi:hypothetical protein
MRDSVTTLRDIAAKLDAMSAELRAVRELVERRERTPAAPRLHTRVASALLPEISAAVGSEVWACIDLLDHCRRDRRLQAAITAAIGAIDSGSTRSLGKLMAQVDGVPIDGYVVERQEANGRDAATWRVLRV